MIDTTKKLTVVLSLLKEQYEQGQVESKTNGLILELVISLLIAKDPDLRAQFSTSIKTMIDSTTTAHPVIIDMMQKYHDLATTDWHEKPNDSITPRLV